MKKKKILICISVILVLVMGLTVFSSAASVSFSSIDTVFYRVDSGSWFSLPSGTMNTFTVYDSSVNIDIRGVGTGSEGMEFKIISSEFPLFYVGSNTLYQISLQTWLHLGTSSVSPTYLTPSTSYITLLDNSGNALTSEFECTSIDGFNHYYEFIVDSPYQYQVYGLKVRFPTVEDTGIASVHQVDFMNLEYDYTTSTEEIEAAIDRGVDKILTAEGYTDGVNDDDRQIVEDYNKIENELTNNTDDGVIKAEDILGTAQSGLQDYVTNLMAFSAMFNSMMDNLPLIKFILTFAISIGLAGILLGIFLNGISKRSLSSDDFKERRNNK